MKSTFPDPPRALLVSALLALIVSACSSGGSPPALGRGTLGANDGSAPAAPAPTPVPSLADPPRQKAALPADRFEARILRIVEQHRARMGTSWKAGCPVPLRDLRIITMPHWGLDGAIHQGELMVHRRYAVAVAKVFNTLFDARFPIERMELANGYMGNDPPLAQRNNTVGFNCRAPVGGGHRWSEHAYGRAVDINPDLNPYVSRSGRIEPLYGRAYVDRSRTADGMIRADDVVVRAFRSIGWRWGGLWPGTKDYMHFSATGR